MEAIVALNPAGRAVQTQAAPQAIVVHGRNEQDQAGVKRYAAGTGTLPMEGQKQHAQRMRAFTDSAAPGGIRLETQTEQETDGANRITPQRTAPHGQPNVPALIPITAGGGMITSQMPALEAHAKSLNGEGQDLRT